MFSKQRCAQRCHHPGHIVPFVEHMPCGLSKIPKDPRIVDFVDEHGFILQSAAALAPNERVDLSFEALTPGTDFSIISKSGMASSFNIKLFHLH